MTRDFERLEKFFNGLVDELRRDGSEFQSMVQRAEKEFKRAGFREEIPVGVENILIVRLDAIGDQILMSGFLRELRKNFPCARITLVVSPIAAPMVEFCPYINEVLTFDKKSLEKNLVNRLEKVLLFCRENLWRKKFAVAFSPRWDFDTAVALLILWLSGARERIGYCVNPFQSWLNNPPPYLAPRYDFLLTKNVVTPRSIITEAEKNFFLLMAVGLRVDEAHMELFFGAEDFLHARELLQAVPSSCKKVTLGIGGSASTKKYPVEKYLVALKKLLKKIWSSSLSAGVTKLTTRITLKKICRVEKF